MTLQTKQFVELTDLIGLRFACNKCGSTLSIPLTDWKLKQSQNRMFLDDCPSCRAGWASLNGSTYESVITKATAALNALRDIMHGEHRAPLGFSLMIEVVPNRS